MDIYSEGKLVEKLEQFALKRDNSFLLFLRGINICEDGKGIFVDALMMPVITFKKDGNLIFIDIAKLDGNFTTIVLYPKFPFVYIGNGKAEFKDEK